MEWFHFDNSDKFFLLREESKLCLVKKQIPKTQLGFNEIQ